MAMRRNELDALLRETIQYPSRKIYFQPPENQKISYPCLIYEFNGLNTRYADDRPYSQIPAWSLTYITRDPDDEIILKLAELPQCSMRQPFRSGNLYHHPYTIHF